ncbi:MAG: GTPase ObgE, partial [Bacteroidota bacterium]
GGDGGRGGHIILRGNEQMWTLLDLKYRKFIKAGKGKPGKNQRKTGKSGEDIKLDVPLGTVVKNEETGEIIGEITEHKQKLIILEGGHGGKGNWHFKSPTNQTPTKATPGGEATEMTCILELKVLADVGLVGFPNAGKSTLLSVMTAAKPKIADYPFTTLVPNLGIVKYRDYKSFVIADIPGIIEGAHQGKGLGHQFLRHIERNAVLLIMISLECDDIRAEFQTILNELEAYNPQLMKKQRLLAISKTDMLGPEELEQLKADLPEGEPYIYLSSVTQTGVQELKDRLWQMINAEEEAARTHIS